MRLSIIFAMALAISPGLILADTDPQTSPAFCGACHTRIYQEWQSSTMAKDINNPVVYQFYTGTNGKGEKDGLGFQGLHPGETGDCADCHVPQLVLDEHAKGKEVDLGVAMKEKLDHGISCNFCHTVTDVHVKKDANGRYDTRITHTVKQDKSGTKYGPFKDAKSPAHPTKYSALHRESRLCAICHLNQEKFLSMSTYKDWEDAFKAGKTDQTCQGCHMPLHEEAVELAVGGPKRKGVRAHTFVGAHDPKMLEKALTLDVKSRVEGDELVVTTTVENVGAGHKVPGAGPIRNVILKIDALDANGKPLQYAGDKKGLLPPLAGMGNPKTKKRDAQDWAGMPGKMYAKVYKTKVIPKLGRAMVGVGGFAAQELAFDTCLKPKEPDTMTFRFKLPKGADKAQVKAKLVYRWAFKPLADRKGWKLEDRPMRSVSQEVKLSDGKVAAR
ncbi:MAG TPA: hypothetical protein ENJ26_00635 [Rhodobacteraceae bacterium]|nr:hypothetical protein [Paracoccaceae bacterium]